MYGLLCVSHILWSFTFTSSNTNNLRLIKHGFDILQAWHISVGDKFKMYYAIWGILLEFFFQILLQNNFKTFNLRWRDIQLSYTVLNVIDVSLWQIVQLANFTIWFIVTYVTISLYKWIKYSNQKKEKEKSPGNLTAFENLAL